MAFQWVKPMKILIFHGCFVNDIAINFEPMNLSNEIKVSGVYHDFPMKYNYMKTL